MLLAVVHVLGAKKKTLKKGDRRNLKNCEDIRSVGMAFILEVKKDIDCNNREEMMCRTCFSAYGRYISP